jgi:hypothetical protein
MDAFSALNADLTSYNYFPTVLNNQHQQHQSFYHDPYFQSQSSFIINDFTSLHLNPTQKYAKETIKSHEFITDEQRSFSITNFAVAEQPSDIVSASSPFPVSLLPAPQANFGPTGVSESVMTQRKDETTKSSLISDLHVTTAIVDTNVFVVSETDEQTTTWKDQVPLHPNYFPELRDPPLRDSDRSTSFTIQSFGAVPRSLVPTKYRSITTTRPSLLPYHFTVVTGNIGDTHSGATNRQVLHHKLSIIIFESFFYSRVVCTFNFDPGGDKSCPAANSGGCIFSLLWLPLDRGKKSWKILKVFLSPIDFALMERHGIVEHLQEASALTMPMKMTASVTTTSAKHVREEDTPRVNWELKSLKFFNDLMDSSYLAQDAFSYLARDAKKNWSFEQEFGNKSTQHTLNFIWFLIKL